MSIYTTPNNQPTGFLIIQPVFNPIIVSQFQHLIQQNTDNKIQMEQKLEADQLHHQSESETNQAIKTPKIGIDRRRRDGILNEVQSLISQHATVLQSLNVSPDDLERGAINLLTTELLDQFKSKKYKCIAYALIIHSIRLMYLPITTKTILNEAEIPEKQVKRILSVLSVHKHVKPSLQTESFLKHFAKNLNLGEKELDMALKINNYLYDDGVIKGEHENVVAAAIVRLLMANGLIRSNLQSVQNIVSMAGCCELSVKSLIRKLDFQEIRKCCHF